LVETKNSYKILVGTLEGKGAVGRPRRSWEDNIRMDFMDMAWEGGTGFIWLRIGISGELL
jgi:hypothetical protein